MAGEYADVRLSSAIEPLSAKDLRDDVLESPMSAQRKPPSS
jgi:hypothetical protein